MSESSRRRLERMAGIVCALALVASTLGAGSAVAKPGSGKKAPPAVEPGWPGSHSPENDPKPGDPGYLAGESPVPVPPEGMSDEKLKQADPAAYAVLVRERAGVERALLAKVRGSLKAAGVTPAGERPLDAAGQKQAAAVLASSAYSPYGYLRFTLVPSGSSYARNGYLGTLYFVYGYYSATTDSYRWYTVSWPGRSGDNIPGHQSVVGVGPIPSYTYDFGFMYGGYRGYEWDGTASFYPGKWRLDPWTGAPYGRSCLEVHGGSGTHLFGATSGCIRLYPTSISSLRSYWTYKMANKYDRATAHLTVLY